MLVYIEYAVIENLIIDYFLLKTSKKNRQAYDVNPKV